MHGSMISYQELELKFKERADIIDIPEINGFLHSFSRALKRFLTPLSYVSEIYLPILSDTEFMQAYERVCIEFCKKVVFVLTKLMTCT